MKKALFTLLLLFIGFAVQSSAQDRSGKVFWRGMVDDRVHLVIRGNRVEPRLVRRKFLSIFCAGLFGAEAARHCLGQPSNPAGAYGEAVIRH